MDSLANLNGKIIPLADAKVSALDRGFLFGDGAYEVVRFTEEGPSFSTSTWNVFPKPR